MSAAQGKTVKLSNVLFLLAYSILLFRAALGNTTFLEYISINGLLFEAFFTVSTCLIGLKLVICDKFSIGELFFACVVVVLFALSYIKSTYSDALVLLLLLVGAKNIELKNIIKCHFVVYLIVMISALLCSIAGLIENYVTYSSLHGYRYSLGNTYPTDFAAGIFYLFLDYAYLKKGRWKFFNTIVILIISAVMYYYTDAIMNFIMSVSFSLIMFFSEKNKYNGNIVSRCFQRFSVFVFPALAALSITVEYIFSLENKIFSSVDLLLNNRLSYGHIAIEKYGLRLFGENIIFYGGGWHTDSSIGYFYIDNGYLYTALVYGIIVLVFFCVCFSIVCLKNKMRDTRLVIIIVFIGVSAIVEPRVVNYLYNAFLLVISNEVLFKKKQSTVLISKHLM